MRTGWQAAAAKKIVAGRNKEALDRDVHPKVKAKLGAAPMTR
jgi:hypothetical protein